MTDNERHLTNLLSWRTQERDAAVKNYRDLSDIHVAEVQKRLNYQKQLDAIEKQLDDFETLRNFAEACCVIVERSHQPLAEIMDRLNDVREIADPSTKRKDADAASRQST